MSTTTLTWSNLLIVMSLVIAEAVRGLDNRAASPVDTAAPALSVMSSIASTVQCRRFRKLAAEHKPAPKVAVAIARELAGFLWAALHPAPVAVK